LIEYAISTATNSEKITMNTIAAGCIECYNLGVTAPKAKLSGSVIFVIFTIFKKVMIKSVLVNIYFCFII
jgi:hypothetical protein